MGFEVRRLVVIMSLVCRFNDCLGHGVVLTAFHCGDSSVFLPPCSAVFMMSVRRSALYRCLVLVILFHVISCVAGLAITNESGILPFVNPHDDIGWLT